MKYFTKTDLKGVNILEKIFERQLRRTAIADSVFVKVGVVPMWQEALVALLKRKMQSCPVNLHVKPQSFPVARE